MVPQDWEAFIANTIAQVESGEIPMARVDDAVTRILRVKMRLGLLGPSATKGALDPGARGSNRGAQLRRAPRSVYAGIGDALATGGGARP
jgi:beta-glucosidase